MKHEDIIAQVALSMPFSALAGLVMLAGAWVAYISMLEACERAYMGLLR